MKNISLPSICFVSHNAYGSMMARKVGSIGGAERQVSVLAKWLASRGFIVSVLTWDEGQPDGIEVDSIRILKICRKDEGVRGVRFFHPKWTGLIRAMQRADADIYYQTCSECVTGQVALWCRRNKRHFIYSIASNGDCNPCLPHMQFIHERILYRYGLRKASLIIAQTLRQQAMLNKHFGRDSVVIPMPCSVPFQNDHWQQSLKFENIGRILWVGRVCQVKRPDLLLELAKMCSDLQFDMVGPIGQNEYSRKIVALAKSVENVKLHGRVTDSFLWNLYKRCSLFCSTSEIEGFPNTFLEAWSCGLPIVSTFDPDNLIAEKGLGKLGKNIPELEEGIRELLNSPEQWQKASQSARKYFLENHGLDTAMKQFERVFCDVVNLRGDKIAGECL